MKLSIIIVNYNVKYYLEQCLHSILASHIDFTYEILVVDNNSTDGSVEYIKSKFDSTLIKLIENKENTGFSKANNQAINEAQGEYILLLNPDTVLGENVLSNASSFIEQNQDTGAVGVKMISGSGLFQIESKRGFPSPWASFCKLCGLAALFPNSPFFGKYNLNYLDENKMHSVPILVGAFMMIRKSVLEKTGLLDESFFMYGEDIDLSYRIIQQGYKNIYLPEKIIHYKGESTDKKDEKHIQAFHNAMLIFYKKYYPNQNRLFSFFIVLGVKFRSLIVSLSKNNKNPKENNPKEIVLDTEKMSYEEIIDYMDKNRNKNTRFNIYNPKTGMIIGTKSVKNIDNASRE